MGLCHTSLRFVSGLCERSSCRLDPEIPEQCGTCLSVTSMVTSYAVIIAPLSREPQPASHMLHLVSPRTRGLSNFMLNLACQPRRNVPQCHSFDIVSPSHPGSSKYGPLLHHSFDMSLGDGTTFIHGDITVDELLLAAGWGGDIASVLFQNDFED